MELDSVLDSVTPMIAFSKYIEEKKIDCNPLLKFVKISKIFFEQLEESQ